MSQLRGEIELLAAPRYAVVGELGGGAAAKVFLATDQTDDRRVAIKVLRPEWAGLINGARFQQEIRILSALRHPHVMPILDSGQFGKLPYYTMPYVGPSLRHRLTQCPPGQFPLHDAIAIAKALAQALDYCHGHGVLHRDIKPENVMPGGAGVLLGDFGIARAITVAGGDRLSSSGLVIGTPYYMSPEQASGREIDERGDLYALACVLYEMLAGEVPFTGRSTQAILARHVSERVPSLRVVRSDITPTLERAVLAALAKKAPDRPASAAEWVSMLD